jgi:CheY-like chemotaxis protein
MTSPSGGGGNSPRKPPASAPPPAVSPDTDPQPARGRNRRILIVEDNRDTAETLRLLFEMFGDSVRTAYLGTAAITTAREFNPQIVLCDISLPGEMDGHAVARALRAEAARPAPFMVAMSGYDSDEDSQRALKSGFDAYLPKPVEFAMLQALLENVPEAT